MKKCIICAALLASFAGTASADWIYREIREAIDEKVPYAELAALENKHMGRLISGEGYLFEVREAGNVNGYDVHIIEDYSTAEQTFMGDVRLEVLKGSPVYKVVEELEPGRRVSFSGRLDDVFGKTIYLRGTVTIKPE